MIRLGVMGGKGLVPWGLAVATCVLLLACFASSARAADRVYWANDGSTSANRISFANVDGSGGGNLNTTVPSGGAPRGVAIDVAAGRVYWTNPINNLISFASLDGSGGGGNLNTAGATVNRPNAPAVYPAAGRIYWGNETGNEISFANLDGSGGHDLIATTSPIAPMVDPGLGRIYWGNANPANSISFANLDGSGVGKLNTTGATVNNPHGVALDPVAGRIYWANIGTTQNPVNVISYANLNGSGGGNLNTAGATVNQPVGVAIDPSARRIYWANEAGNRISFANLEGSGGADLSTPGATLSGSRSAVLLQAPSGAGAPAITGGSAAGSTLTCSQGSWAADLLASWLYRAPQTLAYSWTRDGTAIPGASGNTLTAWAAGRYGCAVTASNPAGSTAQTSAEHAVSPPAFGAKTLVTMSLAGRIPARGPVKVVVRNRNSFKVSGKLSARTTKRGRQLARGKAFVDGAGAKKRVSLKLSKVLSRSLKRHRKLSLRLVARVKDPAGDTRTVSKKVSLRLKRAG